MDSTLEAIKDYFKTVCLKHIDVKSFEVGSVYNISEGNAVDYPLVFLELPYVVNYNLNGSKDELQFSFDVLLTSKPDDLIHDHEGISNAKEIGDAILYYIYNDSTSPIIITSSNAISLKEFSDDNLSGMRYDLVTVLINKLNCTYVSKFDV